VTHHRASLRFRYSLLAFFLLLGLGVWILYAWLPADGATGDLGSFEAGGYRVQRWGTTASVYRQAAICRVQILWGYS